MREQYRLEEARSLLEEGQPESAFQLLKDILGSATEDYLKHYGWRVHEMIGACFHDMADGEGAVQAYLRAAECDPYLRSQREHFSSYLFALHYLPGLSDEWLKEQHCIYGSLYRDMEPVPAGEHREHDKIRIGYIAPDFLDRSAARFYDALLTRYDRSRFEVFCYSLSKKRDAFTGRVNDAVKAYYNFAETSLEEAALMIRNDEIDILFDLGGHSAGGTTLQIMGYRPAPVQLSGIGYFDTTGLPMMDYFLTDSTLVPEGRESQFLEKPLKLSSAFSFVPDESMKNTSSAQRAHGETKVFGCFNNFMKLNNEVLETFKELLLRNPDCKLLLQDTTGMLSRRRAMEKIVMEAGLPTDRVDVRQGNNEYLEAISDVDVMLDTWPYQGGAMTCIAMYMGIPVITLSGTRHGSRFGMSLLKRAGFSEFVAYTKEEYITKAAELMENVSLRQELRKIMRRRLEKSPLLAADEWVRELEEKYVLILRGMQNG